MSERIEPTVQTLIIQKIDAVERNLTRRLDEQDRVSARIESKVDKTNGRVTILEQARERALGTAAAYKWIPDLAKGCLTAAFGAGLTILVLALQGAIH